MVAFFMAQMIGQFTGGATLISSITGLDHVVSLLIFGAVVIIYTSFGGFSAVAITDTIRGNYHVCRYIFTFILCIKKLAADLLVLMPDWHRICLEYMMIYFQSTVPVRYLVSGFL